MPLFLTGTLTPLQQIIVDQWQESCCGLVNFIRASLTCSQAQANSSLGTQLPMHPNPVADALLLDHCQEALEELFPILS